MQTKSPRSSGEEGRCRSFLDEDPHNFDAQKLNGGSWELKNTEEQGSKFDLLVALEEGKGSGSRESLGIDCASSNLGDQGFIYRHNSSDSKWIGSFKTK